MCSLHSVAEVNSTLLLLPYPSGPHAEFQLLCLQAAPRVLFMRAFAHLFDGKPSGLNTLNILRGNSHMIALQHSINQTVIDDFTAAREAVRVSDAGLDLQASQLVPLSQSAFMLASTDQHP